MESEIRSIWEDSYNREEQAFLLETLKEEVRHANIAKSILLLLREESSGFTKREIIESVACRRQRLLQTLKNLVELGKVYKSTGGKKGNPFKYRLQPWNQK